MTVPEPPRPTDDDPTGMRHVLHSLPDPGPMPADLVARITAALEAEQTDRGGSSTLLPLVPRPRRVWPRYAAAAAVAGVALTGGVALLETLRPGTVSQSFRGAAATTADSSGAGGVSAPEAAPSHSAPASGVVDVARTEVYMTGQAYTLSQLAAQADATLANPGQPLREFSAESPSIGPIGTPLGARDCASALGIESSARVVADLGVSAGAQVALILAVSSDGRRTAYLVERDCRIGHPEIVAGPVALAS